VVLEGPARAVPPLVQAVEVADQGLSGWWKEGDFLVGRPDDPARPAMRPLLGPGETTLPQSLTGWTPLGETCEATPKAQGAWGELPLEARIEPSPSLPIVSVYASDRLVSQQALTKPVTVCAVVMVQADAVPGPEVIVAWRMDQVHGFTVFHVPEAVR
jgi:hypothetical protein